MKAVHELRDVRHRDLVGVAVEGVERESCQHRVANGGLLPEEVGGVHVGGHLVPRAPLVHHQLDPLLAVALAHHLPVAGDERLHQVAAARAGRTTRARRTAAASPDGAGDE